MFFFRKETMGVFGHLIAFLFVISLSGCSFTLAIKDLAGIAGASITLSNAPSGFSNVSNLNVGVTGTGSVSYKYKLIIGAGTCADGSGYSSVIPIASPITDDISAAAEGTSFILCVVGINSAGTVQDFGAATSTTWIKDTVAPTGVGAITIGAVIGNIANSPDFSFTAATDVTTSVLRYEAQIIRTSDSAVMQTWTSLGLAIAGDIVSGLNLAFQTQYQIQVRAVDDAGNTGAISTSANWYPHPRVTRVSLPGQRVYGPGQPITVILTFEEEIAVTGTPQIIMTLDSVGPVTLDYVNGNNTKQIDFQYNIPGGVSDFTGITLDNTISLNGGTLNDFPAAVSSDLDLTSLVASVNTNSVWIDDNLHVLSFATLANTDPNLASSSVTVNINPPAPYSFTLPYHVFGEEVSNAGTHIISTFVNVPANAASVTFNISDAGAFAFSQNTAYHVDLDTPAYGTNGALLLASHAQYDYVRLTTGSTSGVTYAMHALSRFFVNRTFDANI